MPGVNGDIYGSHIAAVCNAAFQNGYNIFVFNPTVPSRCEHNTVELIDFSKT